MHDLNENNVPIDPTTLPVVQSIFTFDGRALETGNLKLKEHLTLINQPGSEGAVPPPQIRKDALRVAFLGLFAGDEFARNELLQVAQLYPYQVNTEEFVDHIASWDYWEENPNTIRSRRQPRDFDQMPLLEIMDTKIHRMEHPYVEAILHLCSRERLGPSWPRLIHGLVMTYFLTRDDFDGPIFEPFITARTFGIKEGAIDGYHPVWGVVDRRSKRPVMTPGISKRKSLQRLRKNRKMRKYIDENWDDLAGRLSEMTGAQRRRNLSTEGGAQVLWLFYRHILREPIEEIAAQAGRDVSTVESAVKDLRAVLDLQLKHAVRCLDHRQRPWPLH